MSSQGLSYRNRFFEEPVCIFNCVRDTASGYGLLYMKPLRCDAFPTAEVMFNPQVSGRWVDEPRPMSSGVSRLDPLVNCIRKCRNSQSDRSADEIRASLQRLHDSRGALLQLQEGFGVSRRFWIKARGGLDDLSDRQLEMSTGLRVHRILREEARWKHLFNDGRRCHCKPPLCVTPDVAPGRKSTGCPLERVL